MKLSNIKQFLIGLLIGMMMGIPLVLAAQGLTLQTGGGTETGTTANPLKVIIQ